MKERKHFFFEKKKQKTFHSQGRGATTSMASVIKSFLVLFFKKEHSFS
jgi:hypothetical protein